MNKRIVMMIVMIVMIVIVMMMMLFSKSERYAPLVNERCPAQRYLLMSNVYQDVHTVTAAPPVRRPMCVEVQETPDLPLQRIEDAMLPDQCVSVYRSK